MWDLQCNSMNFSVGSSELRVCVECVVGRRLIIWVSIMCVVVSLSVLWWQCVVLLLKVACAVA